MFLIFLNGYVSLSLELVVLRYLGFWVGSGAVITGIIMGTFLGFMALGYWLGGSRRVRDCAIKRILGIGFLTIALVAMLAGSFPIMTQYFAWMYRAGITVGVTQTFIFSGALLSLGPFLFGFNTTLLSRLLGAGDTGHGDNTGVVMAMDTIGSVLGSLLTTLVLMPMLGVNNTLILICAACAMGALIMWRRWYVLVLAVMLVVTCGYINSNQYQLTRLGILVNNANSTVQVVTFGDQRVLYMNGLPMSIYNPVTNTSSEYIDYVNKNFIDTMPRDRKRRVLVLGAGGFTAGMNDEFHDYTYVDIEHTLRDISEQYFLSRRLTPNKTFVVQDASQFLKNTDAEYDLIMLDVYSNSYQVPEALITAEFMMRIKSRVAPGGIVVMNIVSSPNFSDRYTRIFDNTFHSVFTGNTSRNVIGDFDAWATTRDMPSNIIYAWYNVNNDNRIYTVNRSSVLYDNY